MYLQYLLFQCLSLSLSPSSTVSVSVVSPAVGLARKLVGVLEAVEKLPVYVHETGGQVLNLQVLTRVCAISLPLTLISCAILCSHLSEISL